MPRHVVIAGAGLAGVEAALGLNELAGEDVSITLVSPSGEMIHQPIASAPWSLGGVHRHPMAYVAELLGVQLVRDELVSADPAAGTVRLRRAGDVEYDALLVTVGARRVMALDRAVVYGSPLDVPAVEGVLDLARRGDLAHVVVTVPVGAAWTLPAYEVALRAAECGAQTTIVTPESKVAGVFGDEGSAAVAVELERAGVHVVSGSVEDTEPGQVVLVGEGRLPADAVIALPYVRGARIDGLPADDDGFLPVDPFGRVDGVDDVFAAGDGTSFPIRQGGLACQQAAVAASSIAGGHEPLRPVVRGALPVPGGTLWLLHDLASGEVGASREPLWDPPHRVVGVRLPAFLERLDAETR